MNQSPIDTVRVLISAVCEAVFMGDFPTMKLKHENLFIVCRFVLCTRMWITCVRNHCPVQVFGFAYCD